MIDNLIQKEIGIVQFFPIVYSRNSKKKRKKRVANWIVQVRNKRVVKRRVKKKKKARDHDGERSIETKTERRGERERGVMEVKKFAEEKKQKKREE